MQKFILFKLSDENIRHALKNMFIEQVALDHNNMVTVEDANEFFTDMADNPEVIDFGAFSLKDLNPFIKNCDSERLSQLILKIGLQRAVDTVICEFFIAQCHNNLDYYERGEILYLEDGTAVKATLNALPLTGYIEHIFKL